MNILCKLKYLNNSPGDLGSKKPKQICNIDSIELLNKNISDPIKIKNCENNLKYFILL